VGLALPYDVAVYVAAMARWNAAWFPAAIVGVALALVAVALVALVARPPACRERLAGRLIGLVLAAFALWIGSVHQLGLMATFDFMAPIYGWAWIAHGIVVALVATALGRVRFVLEDGLDALGLVIALAGLVGWPLALVAAGYDWRAVPLVGTAPDPTAIFTAGLLLTARGGARWLLLPLPVAWAAVAALSGHLLSFPFDYAVTGAVLVTVVGMLCRRGGAPTTSGGRDG
jgi:hypothetical protein